MPSTNYRHWKCDLGVYCLHLKELNELLRFLVIRKNFLSLLVCFSTHQSPSKKGLLKQEKSLLPLGANSFLSEYFQFLKECITSLTVLPALCVLISLFSLKSFYVQMGHIKQISDFKQNAQPDPEHSVHGQSIIWAIALHSYIL